MENQELEVKFLVSDLPGIKKKIVSLGAQQSQARTHEVNLRFDTPDGTLRDRASILRLRQDSAARLTYKGPAQSFGGARLRQEIEFIASDFRTAQAFLEALGYQVIMMYEKYRCVYELAGVHIALDELPFGHFIELEGPDPASLRWVNQKIGLDWNAQVMESYSILFDILKNEQGYTFRDLSFPNFQNLIITPGMLHARPADRS
jgi:adenylate cyclase, class 2